MADLKAKYGASTEITITLASLANDGQRQATAVSNATNLFLDALIGGKVKTAASGVAATGYVDLYLAVSADGGTTYSGDASGTDGAYAGKQTNLIFLGRVAANANDTTYEFAGRSVAAACNGAMPQHWTVVVDNQTGAALSATAADSEVHYQGVHAQSV